MKKLIAIFMVIISVISSNTANVCASTEEKVGYEQMIKCLVEAGYTDETARALEYEDIKEVYNSICDGMLLEVYTCAIEKDNLAEIETFLSYSDEELIDMGFSEEEILNAKKTIDDINSLNDFEISKKYGMDSAQIKAFHKAVENGNRNRVQGNNGKKDVNNKVSASGGITSSEMTYTQTVTRNSKTVPNYTVKLSYTWNEVYFLGIFTDKIAVAWGGNLNCDRESGTARYYTWEDGVGEDFGQLKALYGMEIEVSPNTGIIFSFPQRVWHSTTGDSLKTKDGSVSFKLYQTKSQGFDTKIVSAYCHRVISISSAEISFSASASGVSAGVSLSIGGAWDTTTQKRTTISY